jgi:hypothetical protein
MPPEALMSSANATLTRQMLEWIVVRPRTYAEVMQVWRTSCPLLSIWEDACAAGLIEYEAGTGKVTLSCGGRAFLMNA